jgi:hypothetical protein
MSFGTKCLSTNSQLSSQSVRSKRLQLNFCSIFLLAFFTSLEGQTMVDLIVYATSAFSTHSLVATVFVVRGVVNGEPKSSNVIMLDPNSLI